MTLREIKMNAEEDELSAEEIWWLISEVERLTILCDKKYTPPRDYEAAWTMTVAQRCAEIAASTIEANIEKSIGTYPIVFGGRSAEAIRKEFRL